MATDGSRFLEWFESTGRAQKDVQIQFVSDKQGKAEARNIGTAQNGGTLFQIFQIRLNIFGVNKLALKITTHYQEQYFTNISS